MRTRKHIFDTHSLIKEFELCKDEDVQRLFNNTPAKQQYWKEFKEKMTKKSDKLKH